MTRQRRQNQGRVVQEWEVTDPDMLAQMDIPAGKSVVEIPDRMLQLFSQEGRDAGNG